jgi:hypothetical protein
MSVDLPKGLEVDKVLLMFYAEEYTDSNSEMIAYPVLPEKLALHSLQSSLISPFPASPPLPSTGLAIQLFFFLSYFFTSETMDIPILDSYSCEYIYIWVLF